MIKIITKLWHEFKPEEKESWIEHAKQKALEKGQIKGVVRDEQ